MMNLTQFRGFEDYRPKEIKSFGSKILSQADIEKKNEATKTTAKSFEAMMISMMIKQMRETIPKSNLFEDTAQTQQLFTGMLDNALADKMAGRGGFGLADAMYRQLKIDVNFSEPNKNEMVEE